ncbi:Nucleolar protein 10 [Seminavis robusta]|uniref:Nucleolar protein 10 n=1 Tax=Seminavis robusta TaxID=568900 RepID=A0A9N8E9B4_9STRA|nr:Nucleolar protein 10 [Seminavis robusta]|eukprot:Sro767_g199510.1 Nucleolar protein 10 (699) ;mRNA; r:36513-38609
MKKQRKNDTSIYCLSTGAALPEWLGDRAKRNLSKRDESIRRRIELLQDFQMPSSSSKLVQSADGRYIMVAGTYKPRVRCFDVDDLSMKFERYVDAEIVDLVMLGEDYGKMALLRTDRVIEFHAPYGFHETVRIPNSPRGFAYESTTCELMIAAKGNQVYRLNLEEGRFTEPITVDTTDASSSCITVAPTHSLAAIGGDDGVVRLIDSRIPSASQKPILRLDVHGSAKARISSFGNAPIVGAYSQPTKEITSVTFDPNGLYMACGTAGGLAAVYDVRSSRPVVIQEHKNQTSILQMKFHSHDKIITMDEKLVKIWKYKTPAAVGGDGDNSNNDNNAASVVVNVEGTGKLSDFIMAGDSVDPEGYNSGVLLCACDQPKIESYYIPKVGHAPRWCSYLENITEELEEADLVRKGSKAVGDGNEAIFENYKFVSREDVNALGITNLIGTPLLRGYMHGFFMDSNLYNRVKAVANPFAYEEYRKKKLKERMDAKRSSRIAPAKNDDDNKKKKAAINADLADRLESKAAGNKSRSLLGDNRFGGLFSNPDFEINENDEMFKLRNPSGVAAVSSSKSKRKEDYDSQEEDNSVGSEEPPETKPKAVKQKKKPIVYETGDLKEVAMDGKIRDKKQLSLKSKTMDLPIAKRTQQEQSQVSEHITEVKGRFGAKEAVYVPKSSRKKDSEDAAGAAGVDKRSRRKKPRNM